MTTRETGADAGRASGRGGNFAEGRVRSRDGTAIGFLKLGAGPALAFVHGSLSTGEEWLPVAKLLAAQFTCYLMTRRGRGRSDAGPAHSLDRECDDLDALLEAAGSGARIVGHSYGAVCALETVRRGARVAQLVLYEPPLAIAAPVVDPVALEAYRAALAAGDPEEAIAAGFRGIVRLPERELQSLRKSFVWRASVKLAPTWLLELDALAQLPPGAERYREVATPTLLMQGGLTPPHHRAAIAALAAVLPNAQTVTIEGQGHSAHLMAPAQVAAAVAGFLGEQPGRVG